MCELAIPLCIHLSISRIYTVGWDCKNIGDKSFVCDDIIDTVYNNIKNNSTEFNYVPYIKKIK
jgi:hypothetical protein